MAAAGPAPAVAGTLSVEQVSVPGPNAKNPIPGYTVRFTGLIEVPDADKLRAEFSKIRAKASPDGTRSPVTIEFSSQGGDLLEGIRIGYLLREFEVAAMVRKDDTCLSACALAFLGGTQSRQPPSPIPSRRIAIGGKVGFHNFSINVTEIQSETKGEAAAGIRKSFNLARAGVAQLMRFAADMGIAPAFISQLVSQPPEQWQLVVTVDDFLETGSCPAGSLPNPGRTEVQAANICLNATGGRIDVEPPRAQRISVPAAQRRLLERVRDSILGTNLKGTLASQLAAVVVNSDQRLIDSVYADLRAAGVVLPDMKGTYFEVPLELGSAGPLMCHVSLSPDSLDAFDVALATSNGFFRAFRAPPPGCPLLFRYNGNDAINPGSVQ